jgi:hypothetical protein
VVTNGRKQSSAPYGRELSIHEHHPKQSALQRRWLYRPYEVCFSGSMAGSLARMLASMRVRLLAQICVALIRRESPQLVNSCASAVEMYFQSEHVRTALWSSHGPFGDIGRNALPGS